MAIASAAEAPTKRARTFLNICEIFGEKKTQTVLLKCSFVFFNFFDVDFILHNFACKNKRIR